MTNCFQLILFLLQQHCSCVALDVVMGLIPVGIEKSHEGISLSTLSVIGMSRSDQQRLFTIMLRESDSETIRGNGAR